MTPNKFYYISSGEKNAMRTLRHVISTPGYVRDEYVCNLSRDWDEAVAKARAKIGTKANLNANEFELNDWGQDVGIKPWMRRQLELIKLGVMPFGKHKGAQIVDLDDGYVKFWVEQTATNVVGQALVQKFTDIANERDLFAKWEQQEQERQAAHKEKVAKMSHVGKVGKRQEFFLRCDKVLSFDGGGWGYNAVTTYMNICADRYGNEFVYKGSNAWEEGKYYKVKATVKTHKEYNGKPQTFISRPTVIKVVEKTSEDA